jgi:hypothetical protein
MTSIAHTRMTSAAPGACARSVGYALKKTLWVFLAALLVVCVLAPQAHAAFGYRMPITINRTKVSGTQNNFPVLISSPPPALNRDQRRHVKNGSGYDIVSGGATAPSRCPRYELHCLSGSNRLGEGADDLLGGNTPSMFLRRRLDQFAYGDPASVWDSN